jgi:hypothetical protein
MLRLAIACLKIILLYIAVLVENFDFNAAPGFKFVLSYKNVNGKVWIIRNNTTKLAQSLISY